jgi:inward rectifier potassium channel
LATLLASFIVIYGGVNALFATCYWLGGGGTILNARPGSFADDFWFSVQTYVTIGDGSLAPGSTYAHLLVTLQSFCGMLSLALTTGVLFASSRDPNRVWRSARTPGYRAQRPAVPALARRKPS